MGKQISFIGADMYIGERTHIYPGALGYWADHYSKDMRGNTAQTMVMDDFGNLVDVLPAAHQRAAYRHQQH